MKRLYINTILMFMAYITMYLVPIIILPYLSRKIGLEKLGILLFAQSLLQILNVFVDFGLSLYSIAEIASLRARKGNLSLRFSEVLFTKLMLVFVVLLLLVVMISVFDTFKKYWFVYMYYYVGLVFQHFTFPWFFQGLEKMEYIFYINLISRTIYLISVVLFVSDSSKFYYVPLFNALGFAVAAIFSFYLILGREGISISVPRFQSILEIIKSSFPYFLSRLSVSVYYYINTFFLGLFVDKPSLVAYSVPEKIFRAMQQIYLPVVNTLYPYMVRKKDFSLYKKLFYLINAFNIILVVSLLGLSKYIIGLFLPAENSYYIKAMEVFKVMILGLLLVVPSILLGYPLQVALGQEKYANYSVVVGSIIHVIFLLLLAIFSEVNIYHVAFVLILSEFFVLFIRFLGVLRLKTWS